MLLFHSYRALALGTSQSVGVKKQHLLSDLIILPQNKDFEGKYIP